MNPSYKLERSSSADLLPKIKKVPRLVVYLHG